MERITDETMQPFEKEHIDTVRKAAPERMVENTACDIIRKVKERWK